MGDDDANEYRAHVLADKDHAKNRKPSRNTIPAVTQPPKGITRLARDSGRHTILLSRRRREASTRAAAVPNTEEIEAHSEPRQGGGIAYQDAQRLADQKYENEGKNRRGAGEEGALAAIGLGGQQHAGPAHQVGGRLGRRQFGQPGGERGVGLEFGGTGGALARRVPAPGALRRDPAGPPR